MLSPGTAASGGTEANTLTLTDTLPVGVTPGTTTSQSDWLCGTAARVVACFYTPASAIAAGTALPDITIPITLTAGLSGTVSSTEGISSDGCAACDERARGHGERLHRVVHAGVGGETDSP